MLLLPELIRLVALVAGPFDSRSIKDTCRTLRDLVTPADLLWAEAGWMLSRHGVDLTFGWAMYRTGAGKIVRSLACSMTSQPADKRDTYTPLSIALGTAVSEGDVVTAELLLGLGAGREKVGKPTERCSENPYSLDRLLITAAEKNLVDMIALLVGAGADVNARRGKSLHRETNALAAAAERGCLNAVSALLGAGAEDHDGTALIAAAGYNQLDVARVLHTRRKEYPEGTYRIDLGKLALTSEMADFLIRSGYAEGAGRILVFAASRNKQKLTRALLIHRDVFSQGDLDTALDEALRRKNIETASLLLSAGANAGTLCPEGAGVFQKYAWLL